MKKFIFIISLLVLNTVIVPSQSTELKPVSCSAGHKEQTEHKKRDEAALLAGLKWTRFNRQNLEKVTAELEYDGNGTLLTSDICFNFGEQRWKTVKYNEKINGDKNQINCWASGNIASSEIDPELEVLSDTYRKRLHDYIKKNKKPFKARSFQIQVEGVKEIEPAWPATADAKETIEAAIQYNPEGLIMHTFVIFKTPDKLFLTLEQMLEDKKVIIERRAPHYGLFGFQDFLLEDRNIRARFKQYRDVVHAYANQHKPWKLCCVAPKLTRRFQIVNNTVTEQ